MSRVRAVLPPAAIGLAFFLLLLVATTAFPPRSHAAEDWVIKSFGARFAIKTDGSIDVTEDLLVDFRDLPSHGIDREIDFRLEVEKASPNDKTREREYKIEVTSVTDGQNAVPYKVSTIGAKKRIRIGDPAREVTGQNRYVITYRLLGALNSLDEWDEFNWNVTGDTWPVPIERASAIVTAPSITNVECFQGRRLSTERCETGISPSRAEYQSTRVLQAGEQLTVLAALQKGSVQVGPPILTTKKSFGEQARDFLGLKPLPIALAVAAGVAALGGLLRLWWTQGRDRWYGDVQYLTGRETEAERPLGARETVVVEYAPPDIGKPGRPLRPAEVGVLMDERADTLDVSATIVDLAVRGYLRIMEPEKHEYTLQKLRDADGALLDYESKLLNSLFDDADSEGKVKLKDLEDKFSRDLSAVKSKLYKMTTKDDRMFASNPETTRLWYAGGGLALGAVGGLIIAGLGLIGAGLIGIPVAAAGLLLLVLSGTMSRRTAAGRELYRRARGFREYMVTAETDRARFAEEANLFEKYLPYAIVYGCTDKWAKAFEGLAREPTTSGWYVSPNPFVPLAFAHDIGSFSSSVSSVMASTPSSSGRSGFGGGGFAGGGGGGGGGGRW